MKALKRRPAIAKGVIIFAAIFLALAMVLPVLAEGPGGHGGKPDKSEKGGQPETRGQSGDANSGQAGQAKAQTNKADSHGKQDQARSRQADSPGKQDQARSRQADSQGKQDQARLRQADSQGKQDQARLRQADSQGKQGQGKARPDQASPRGNKGKAKLGATKSHDNKGRGNRGQAQGLAQPEPGVNPGLLMLDNTRREGHRLQANPVLGASAAFTSSNDGFRVCRYRGKPQAVVFSDLSQGGSIVTISNAGGLKNLRITVNGQRFQVHLDSQAASNMVDVDVSSALLDSGTNSIVFTALGKPGTCAMVHLR